MLTPDDFQQEGYCEAYIKYVDDCYRAQASGEDPEQGVGEPEDTAPLDGEAMILHNRFGTYDLLPLSLPCRLGDTLYLRIGDGGYYLCGALLSRLRALEFALFVKESRPSLQEAIYLLFISKLVEGLLQLSALDDGVAVSLMEFAILPCIVRFRHCGHGLWFRLHGHLHQYAP
ncbi:hypothetical protein Cgig2_031594 [Carnegiea gigantea]|uniref:Uncharacterized protein n=1 Tax=Carnegiea gigantea TaxID=171969 RepID=A0A9Q1QH67_9CARY|nr:hypothetical protein Cgig2_031594 [Carnegiea gigantea]